MTGSAGGPPARASVRLVWRKGLSGSLRVLQLMSLGTGTVGLVSLAGSPVDSWFRNGVGAVVGVLIALTFVWTTWFGVGWAYLRVHRGQVRLGFSPLVWARPSFPLLALAHVSSTEVDLFERGGRMVAGDPRSPGGLLVSSGGREAVRMHLWDGRTYLVTLRRSEEVVLRLQELIDDGT